MTDELSTVEPNVNTVESTVDDFTPYTGGDVSVDGYTPVFNNTVRTVIYVVCFIIGLAGGILTVVAAIAGAPVWATVTAAIFAWVAPQVANAFGVAYNPLKLASK